jgi:hypothetical protein
MLERPGLYGAALDWRLMSGPDRLPVPGARDAQARRLAAWLELMYWWQWAAPAFADPGPRTASLCVKLVSEPARIWLWLAHGWQGDDRPHVLREALDRLPEEEAGLRLALALHHELARSPDPPLDQILPMLLRLSARIAARLAEEVADAGATDVRLAGSARDVAVPHAMERASDPLPLCDWRSLAHPKLPDETFFLFPGDASRPETLVAAAAACAYGPLPVLRSDGLMVSAGLQRNRTGLRAVKCPLTDPVSSPSPTGGRSPPSPTSPAGRPRTGRAERSPSIARGCRCRPPPFRAFARSTRSAACSRCS